MTTPQETIMEQFKVIEDAVRDLKEMIEPKKEDWFATQHPASPANNIPDGWDSEGNMTNFN